MPPRVRGEHAHVELLRAEADRRARARSCRSGARASASRSGRTARCRRRRGRRPRATSRSCRTRSCRSARGSSSRSPATARRPACRRSGSCRTEAAAEQVADQAGVRCRDGERRCRKNRRNQETQTSRHRHPHPHPRRPQKLLSLSSGIKREQSPSRGTPFPRSRGYRELRVKRADEGADSSEVTAVSPAASGAPLDDDALIELSRSSASDHLVRA